MDVLSRSDIRSLMDMSTQNGSLCVSIYAPTHPGSSQSIKEQMIRYKNLLSDADRQLVAYGQAGGRAKRFLEPAAHLLEDARFWRYASNGLAVFLTANSMRYYRLGVTFEPLAVVGHHWYLKPLLPLFSGDGRYYVLALSLNEVRLMQCSRNECQQIDLGKKTPTSLGEVMKYNIPGKITSFHTRTAGPGTRSAMYFGSFEWPDEAKKKRDIADFLQQLNHGLGRLLGIQGSPLVLAGVEYLCSMFKEISSYPNIQEQTIQGNPELWSPKELHERSWPIVEKQFKQAQQLAADRYSLAVSRNAGSNTLEEVVPAAASGRVDTLFVDVGLRQWGKFDPSENAVHMHGRQQNEDEDLTDLAAVQTLLHDGTVYAVPADEMPNGEQVAAVFRY